LFSLLVGDYPAAQPVAITDASPRAVIYYTIDGSDPSTTSTVYSGPITLSSTVKLKAIAAGPYVNSEISEAVYTIADAPEFSAVAAAARQTGDATEDVSTTARTVTIKDKTPGVVIYYTTDGRAPSTKSARYTGPITLVKITTIKAFAVAKGYIDSPLSAKTYVIELPRPAIAWAAPAAIPYGTKLSKTELDATAAVPGRFTYSPKPGTVLDVGTHRLSVTFTPTNPDAYTTAAKTVEIDVQKATITVSASNLSVAFGKPIPEFTFTLKGFVNGENCNLISGWPKESTTAKKGSPPGTYPITVGLGTLGAANYKFAFVDAKLTITP
jgi:hypothetical protein